MRWCVWAVQYLHCGLESFPHPYDISMEFERKVSSVTMIREVNASPVRVLVSGQAHLLGPFNETPPWASVSMCSRR